MVRRRGPFTLPSPSVSLFAILTPLSLVSTFEASQKPLCPPFHPSSSPSPPTPPLPRPPSPPGYYFRPGFRNGASSWHIHLPPGGWCSSLSACANRSTTFLGSSKPERQKDSPYSNASYAYLGILSTGPYVNRAFRNWNLVVPIYCDGGGFQGTAGWVKVNNSFGIYMDGWNGVKAVLADVKELRGMQSAERVLLSGQSAGAQTVLTLCEHMREYAPNAKTIKCLMDSGSFTDSNDRYGQPFFQRMASDIVALHKFTGSTKCAQ
ncbi:unnamed protein product, partial [Closterium sp. NIES-65]